MISQRGTTFDADGTGFGDVDLLGRRVQFRVATTFDERVSEPVAAGGCTRSVRPGRDTAASNVGASLTGRSRQVTLAALTGGRQLSELFGTTEYDGVRARLLRGGSTFSADGDVLSGPVTFQVDRCTGSGWTVELTPRRAGSDLTVHRSRLTDAFVACNPSVDSNTTISTSYVGQADDGSLRVRVTIPELGQDDANGLIAGVTGRATCDRAFGGEDAWSLSGGAISGDDVSFRVPVPAILDLGSACRIGVVVSFAGGGSAAPASRRVDLTRAAGVVADQVVIVVSGRLDRARTARYEGRRVGVLGLGGREDVVAVRHDGSGVPCRESIHGASIWQFEVRGTNLTACSSGSHEIVYRRQDLDDDGRGAFIVRASVTGLSSGRGTIERTLPVCSLPGGAPRSPCAPEPPPCEFDPNLDADDPDCPEPCEFDPSVPSDSPACLPPPPPPCEHDPTIPADDPACVPPDPSARPGRGGS